MNLLLRFLSTFIRSSFRAKITPFDESRLRLRVWPNDFDAYLHLNNGRYLSMMDLGRLDLVIRNGMGRLMWSRKWFPVVGSSMIRYRRSIDAFRGFELVSWIAGWDDKWVYVAHRFERNGELMAAAVVQAVFRGPEGTIEPFRFFRELGPDVEPVRMPQWVVDWQSADLEMKSQAALRMRPEPLPEE